MIWNNKNKCRPTKQWRNFWINFIGKFLWHRCDRSIKQRNNLVGNVDDDFEAHNAQLSPCPYFYYRFFRCALGFLWCHLKRLLKRKKTRFSLLPAIQNLAKIWFFFISKTSKSKSNWSKSVAYQTKRRKIEKNECHKMELVLEKLPLHLRSNLCMK